MRHIKPGESIVMQEFERIAAERGWTTQSNVRTAQDAEPPTTMEDIDRMLAGVKESEPQDILVGGVQKALQRTLGGDILGPKGPDGMWGWFTAKAWNEFAKRHPEAGLPQATEKQRPNDAMLMKMLEASKPKAPEEKMPEAPVPLHLVKEPHMTQPWQYPMGPELKKLVPTSSKSIVDELVALANDLDEMGETKVAEAVDEQLHIYKAAVDKLYDVTGETGEQLVGEAHPGGGPTMAPAKEEGGKVETIVEEQKKLMKVVEKAPTGKQAAFVAKQLVALANRLDAEGKTEAALLVDKTLAELREGSPRPFVGASKTAANPIGFHPPAPPAAAAAVGTVVPAVGEAAAKAAPAAAASRAARLGGWLGRLRFLGRGLGFWGTVISVVVTAVPWVFQKLSSRVENVWEDSEDLLKSAQTLTGADAAKLEPFRTRLETLVRPLAQSVKDTYSQASSKDGAPKFAEALKNFEASMPEMQSIVDGMVEAAPWGAFARTRFVQEHLADLFKAFGALKSEFAAAARSAVAVASGKTPAPEAGKKEVGTEKKTPEKVGTEVARLRGTLRSLAPALDKMQQNIPPGSRDRMMKVLSKALEGKKTTPLKFIAWVKNNQNINIKDPDTASAWNDYLWNIGKSLNIVASVSVRMSKTAQEPPPGFGAKPTTKPTAKAPGARHPARKPREDLRQFQQVMAQLPGLPPGSPGPADGIWGKRTREAWETLRSWTQNKAFGQSPPANDPRGPLEAEVQRAVRVAEWFRTRQQGGGRVPIGGVEMSMAAFQSSANFLRELARVGKIKRSESGGLDTTENRKVAADMLREFADKAEDDVNLVARLGDKEVANLVARANALLAEFERPAGIPGSYRMPEGGRGGRPGYGERQPYGRERGVGDLGTLEGGRGGYGERGRGERGYGERGYGERGEPRMSLEAEVNAVPDVSGFVNDPAQFAAWAQRYWWDKYQEEGEPYVIAHKVIGFLRNWIARLQNRVLKEPTRDREDLTSTLRQRHEAVTDVYRVLPKGR